MILDALEPRSVFHFFEEICAIPHGSGNTQALSDHLVRFADARGLEHHQDALGNVVIIAPAAPGYEQIEVRPKPGVLTSASGTVHTPRGDVSVAWEKNGAGLKLEISCDAEMKSRIKSEIETKTAK